MAEFTSYAPGVPCWIDLAWSDQRAAQAFYGELLGWEVLELGPEAGGYAFFTKGGKAVAGSGPKMMGDEQPSVWTTYIAVEDADSTAAAIQSAGGAVIVPPMQVMDSGKMAIFAAPDGSVAGLWEAGNFAGAALANEPGAFTWNELQSRNTDAASTFGTTVFGWTPETSDFGGHAYTMFTVKEAPAAGMMAMPDEVPSEVPSYWLVYFAVDDVDRHVARATELGATVFVPAMDSPAGRFAVLGDPEGAPFALIEVPSA